MINCTDSVTLVIENALNSGTCNCVFFINCHWADNALLMSDLNYFYNDNHNVQSQ